jgi:steroid delta-isomerase-like uncharacterized protein
MPTEDNKALSRRYYEEVWNGGNTALLDEVMAENHVNHAPPAPVLGREAFKQYVAAYRAAFPDFHLTIEDQLAEGDKVVDRWVVRGTHQGSLMGIPPTGKQATVTGMSIGRFANGKLEETWADFDLLGLMQQIGVVPTM